eukprot:SAG22_NODE_3589_length_1629_cov_2.138562_2_plen_91_part_01
MPATTPLIWKVARHDTHHRRQVDSCPARTPLPSIAVKVHDGEHLQVLPRLTVSLLRGLLVCLQLPCRTIACVAKNWRVAVVVLGEPSWISF